MADPLKLSIKIFADCADIERVSEMAVNPIVRGFTTNPTLMRQSGVTDYQAFAKLMLEKVGGRSISFEVFSDEFQEMERQAHVIAEWGTNVLVKIPVTNTKGESTAGLVQRLSADQVKVNVTAIMTLEQVEEVCGVLGESRGAVISVFAGRIADTGRDPVPLMAAAIDIIRPFPNVELLWASPREVLNVAQADQIGCDIITVTYDLLRKLEFFGRDLTGFSLDTVRMFHDDAKAADLRL